jgi:hypothetical protein
MSQIASACPILANELVDALNHRANLERKSKRTERRCGWPLFLVAVGFEGLCRLRVDLRALLRLRQLSLGQLLALVVGGTFGLAPLLQAVIQSVKNSCGGKKAWEAALSSKYPSRRNVPLNNILVLPANLVAQPTDRAELASWL